ncbi:MAG: hypothetical protein ACRD0U_02220, partial [Acidimicrobiales bacterium]
MRTNQVFKFVSVRPPQAADGSGASIPLPPFRLDRPTRLQDAVAALDGQPDARAQAEGLAREFLGSDRYSPRSPDAAPLLQMLARIELAIQQLPATVRGDELAAAIEREIGHSPGQLVRSAAYRAAESNLWDSLYANALVPGERPVDRDGLVRALRITRLLDVASDPAAADQELPVKPLQSAVPLLPPALFPPRPEPSRTDPNGRTPPHPADALLKARADLQAARDEVQRVYRRNRAAVLAAIPGEIASSPPGLAEVGRETGLRAESPETVLRGPKPAPVREVPLWRFTPGELSEETRLVLQRLGVSADVDDVPQAIDRLAREIGRVNA